MHRFIPPITDSDPELVSRAESEFLPPDQLLALKTRVRRLLKLPEDSVVMISELACADTGCPLLETTVAVFAEAVPTRSWKFTRPRAALTELMLRQAFAGKAG